MRDTKPDRFAIWSTIIDNFLLRNATWNDVVHHEMEEAIRYAIENESRQLQRVEKYGLDEPDRTIKNYEKLKRRRAR